MKRQVPVVMVSGIVFFYHLCTGLMIARKANGTI